MNAARRYFIPESAPAGYVAAILSVGIHHPAEHEEPLEAELVRRGVPAGALLIDNLLANGSRDYRYFVVGFDGAKIIDNSGQFTASLPALEGWSMGAYKACPFPLNPSLLTKELCGRLLPPRLRLLR